MKKLYLICALLGFTGLWASDTYFEKSITFNSPRALGQGNSFVAQVNGLESFEYNPAGLLSKKEFTMISGNFNLISNLIQLNDDLIDIYNEDNGTNEEEVSLNQYSYFMDLENRLEVVKALLNQASVPYGDNIYANGLGIAPAISTGITGNGFGLGFLLNMDSEIYGTELHTSQFNSVITASILLGYALNFDLGLIKLDVGAAVRPMYKIRSVSNLSPIVDYLMDDANSDFIEELNYYTGIGMGFDVGAKLHVWDLVVGLSIADIMGTKIQYSENTYENINNGKFMTSDIIEDEYVTPTSVDFGFAFNPKIGSLNKLLDPTISADYKFIFTDSNDLENYTKGNDFFNNLSLGAEVGLLSFIDVRAGLNQGYLTLGLGMKLLILDINCAVYSFELGENVGDRQQMGAVLEFAVRL
ncbi:MAG: hypothetical protein JXR64_07270 [Spirochaetales bacterium]|nr:hypothetical protein [Spirochaetales bacterium]